MNNTQPIAKEYIELIDLGLDSNCVLTKQIATAFEKYILEKNEEVVKETHDSVYWENESDLANAALEDANETIALLEREIEQLKSHSMKGQIYE